MALKLQSFLLIISAFLVVSAPFGVSTSYGARKTLAINDEAMTPESAASDVGGRYVALNPKDPKVVEIAKFAINEYNKVQKTSIAFVKVREAAYAKIARGLSYGIVIEARDGAGLHDYNANVLVNQNSKTLVGIKKND